MFLLSAVRDFGRYTWKGFAKVPKHNPQTHTHSHGRTHQHKYTSLLLTWDMLWLPKIIIYHNYRWWTNWMKHCIIVCYLKSRNDVLQLTAAYAYIITQLSWWFQSMRTTAVLCFLSSVNIPSFFFFPHCPITKFLRTCCFNSVFTWWKQCRQWPLVN